MSRTEAALLIQRLLNVTDDLKDQRWNESVPQHVATASDVHIKYIVEAAAELSRLHGFSE